MGGLGHDLKAGVNFINEPRLFITFNTGKGDLAFTHLHERSERPDSTASLNDGDCHANIPTKQFGDLRAGRLAGQRGLTLNLGLRYDLMTGYQIDQSKNPNFVALQTAGSSGPPHRHDWVRGLRQGSRRKTRTTSSRGSAWRGTSRQNGNGRVRAGWGIYTDVGYTNSNVLFAAADATGSASGRF